MEEKNKYIIFEVSGGHGKGILATAVVEAIKKKYPEYKIIVITAWDAPWINNPHIFRYYVFGQQTYFYDDYMNDDTIIMRLDPYLTNDHAHQKTHLIETWCKLYNIPYNGEQPKIYVNPREIEIAKDKIKPDNRPIMLIQTNGGAQGQYSKKSWVRDLPIEQAQMIVNYFAKSYRILHIKTPEQPILANAEQLILPLREVYGVFFLCKKRLFIDSFAQHAAAALGLKSTVCWIGNKPEVFGYKMHDNILPNAKMIHKENKYSYVDEYDISGSILQQFPYDTVNLFDVNEIINSVKNQ